MAINETIGIVVGGGPAPGTNAVIAATALEAVKLGCTPIGFHDGFHFLAQRYTDEQHEMTVDEVPRIHLAGGVMLGASRTDVARDRLNLENAVAALHKLAIDGAGRRRRRRPRAQRDGGRAGERRAHQGGPGTQEHRQRPGHAASRVPRWGSRPRGTSASSWSKNLMEDARTSGRWYLGVTMGRPTGHLTLGIGKAVSATCTVIPEEFRRLRDLVSDIADIVEGSIIKRRAMGKPHGVAFLCEALVERFNPKEVAELEDVDRDAQGNIRVTEMDLGRKVINEVQLRLEKRGIKVTIVDKTIGYELRCAPPIAYGSRVCARSGLRGGHPPAQWRVGRDDHDSGRRLPADSVRRDRGPGDRARPPATCGYRDRKLPSGARLHGAARSEGFCQRGMGGQAGRKCRSSAAGVSCALREVRQLERVFAESVPYKDDVQRRARRERTGDALGSTNHIAIRSTPRLRRVERLCELCDLCVDLVAATKSTAIPRKETSFARIQLLQPGCV